VPYSAPLDGLRAIAILAVLIFHIRAPWLRGGFTGVDVFFVISGYLITSIILPDMEKGTFSMREFYLRRVQRLMPNILATVVGVLILWGICFPPSLVAKAGAHGLWTLINGSNFYIWKNLGGYWGDSAANAPLLHTWSLAIEEQFYMVFPGFMLILFSVQRRRLLLWLLFVTGLSLWLCLWGTRVHPELSFYMMPFRVWELLLGAALAVHQVGGPDGSRGRLWKSNRAAAMAGWVGFATILYGFVAIREGHGFPGAIALVPVLGTVLILSSVSEAQTALTRLLSMPTLVWLGKLSYSLYLWHWPLIVFGRIQAELHGYSGLLGSLYGGAASFFVSWLVYEWLEQPLRRRGPGRLRRLVFIGAGGFAVAGCCLVISTRRDIPDPNHRFEIPAFYGLNYSAGRAVDNSKIFQSDRYRDVYFATAVIRGEDPWRSGGVIHAYGGGNPSVVVIGSSHALMYGKVIDDLCRKRRISVAFMCVDATPAFFAATVNDSFPTKESARSFDEARKSWLRQWHPNSVFIIDRWDRYADDLGNYEKLLKAFLEDITPHAEHVFVLSQVPVLRTGKVLNPREYANWRFSRSHTWPRMWPDRDESARQQIRSITDRVITGMPNVQHLLMDSFFYEPDGSIRWRLGRSFFYVDDDHLSQAGAEWVAPEFDSVMPK
jgi:peptidoglycan/LPS O-acetylase OafA/YrhL